MGQAKTVIRPVLGEPEASIAEPCDEHCDPDCVNHTPSVGWDLSLGSRINFHPVDTTDGRLIVSLHLSDDAIANRMVYREVRPDQVAMFARQLGELLAATTANPTVDGIMRLVFRYAEARLLRNFSTPTRRQKGDRYFEGRHADDVAECARLEHEIRAALKRIGNPHRPTRDSSQPEEPQP